MSTVTIPEDFASVGQTPDLLVYNYESSAEVNLKSRITITGHLFSFLLEGGKKVHFHDLSVSCDNTRGILFTSGNCLMTERAFLEKHYRSLLFFFSDARLAEIKDKYPDLFSRPCKEEPPGCFILNQDEFIQHFVASLRHIAARGAVLTSPMLQLKLEELMLYLAHTYPQTFPAFIAALHTEGQDGRLGRVVGNNIYNNLTLDELAFLCHMSLSTFKRKFEKVYGMPPNRWFHEKRMQRAAMMLRHEHLRASEIHEDLGYENLSSFIQAFKKEFGMTPKAYQEQVTSGLTFLR